jgi:Flp pilus assembly protein TadB
MNRAALLLAGFAWLGATLVLGELRGFRGARLTDRIQPYVPGVGRPRVRSGTLSVASFRDVVAPLAASTGDRLSRLLGVRETLATKLERTHTTTSVSAFRMRQLGEALISLLLASALVVLAGPPPAVAGLLLLGTPALAFLVREQQISRASADWQQQLLVELPVVSEQLGMLLAAGYSVGGALNRLAHRGSGACAMDLRRVCGRMRQGLSERVALEEWAALAAVPALDRLVAVIALNRDANDLSRLVSDEARAIRRDAHRRLLETIERRGQQVWIPVTVATLVPGVLFMVVPFVQAMRLFTTG